MLVMNYQLIVALILLIVIIIECIDMIKFYNIFFITVITLTVIMITCVGNENLICSIGPAMCSIYISIPDYSLSWDEC